MDLITNSNDVMENNASSGGKQKSKFLLLASVLLFLLIVLLVIIISQRNNQPGNVTQLQPTPATSQPTPPVKDVAASAIQAPQVSFGAWTGLQATATFPTSASVYSFKTNYTFDEAKTMLNKLGFKADIETQSNAVVGYYSDDSGKNIALAAVDLTNGNMAYNSTDGIKLPAGATLEAKALALLKTVGLYDNTMVAGAQYKSKKHPGKTFIEIHRSWDKLGLPVLNPVGLMNIPENRKLANATLQSVNANNPVDSDIFATSDSSDGKARSDDFNTIVLAVSDADQKVTLIKSNIRPLQTAAPTTTSLISYDDAVAMLKSGSYEFIYTSPTGGGSGMPWETVFPQNKAEAQTAVVSESMVAYLESHPSSAQDMMKPYYIFRGTAQLTSGYMASFVAAVPATNKTVGRSLIPVAHAQQDERGQQQGSFDLNNTQNPQTNNPLTPTAVPPIQTGSPLPPAAGDQSVCEPPVTAMNPIINYGGTYFGYTLRPGRDTHEWYYIPTAGNVAVDSVVITNLQTLVNQLQAAHNGQTFTEPVTQPATQTQQGVTPTIYETNLGDSGQKQSTFEVPTVAQPTFAPVAVQNSEFVIRKFKKIEGDIQEQVDYCPIRLTGSSPSLFVYAPEGSQVSVQPGAKLTYSDPFIKSGDSWNVSTISNGALKVNGVERGYAYYEYRGASFSKPEAGWVVNKGKLNEFVQTVLVSGLGLNAKEAERAVFELKHAAGAVNGNTLFVGLIDKSEVAKNLPLAISPQPAVVYRYHFYVSEAAGQNPVAPKLEAISRKPFMVVELGSYSVK